MSLWGNFFTPQMYNLCLIFSPLLLITPINLDIKNNISRVKAIYRIGPHNKDVISVIFGSLLGDAYGERRLKGVGTRISFYQEDVHVEYIFYLHKFFSDSGYCNPKIPSLSRRLGQKGRIRKIVRFSTFTYTSFN